MSAVDKAAVTASNSITVTDVADISNKAGKKRRKRTNTNNPLADARRHQKQSTYKSKKQLQAESLWHRKSGAGFSLFVSYYGEQPLGVVVDGKESSITDSGSSKRPTAATMQGGQSRASKRRNKKKQKKGKDGQVTVKTSTCSEESRRIAETYEADTRLSSSPLFRALEATSQKHTHLTPFFGALSKPLPLTFRLRSYSENGQQSGLFDNLQYRLEELSDLVAPVPYDPTRRIYQATCPSLSKSSLSRVSSPLKSLLLEHSMNGTLARQELGSMLPVLALCGGGWLKKGDRVLDMCSSPGSKTLQALEVVASTADGTSQEKERVQNNSNAKKGRVVANDVHPTRVESLKEAITRSGLASSITSRVTFTNFDASLFPFPNSGKLFDAVIADVPCSGDGTIRKDAHILPMWRPETGNALHGLQVRILIRALELVKVGGVVSYSTCSLNPVEDEAVVAAALTKFQKAGANIAGKDTTPAVEIIEWPKDLLPGLVRQQGVSSWNVADYTGETDNPDDQHDERANLRWHSTYEDAVKAGMENAEQSLWPLSRGDQEKNRGLHLERCSRLWPQDQDTGGFFVTLLRKNRPLR